MKIVKTVKIELTPAALLAPSHCSTSIQKPEQDVNACVSMAIFPEDVFYAVFDKMGLEDVLPFLTLSKSMYPVAESSMRTKKEELSNLLHNVVKNYLTAFDVNYGDKAAKHDLGGSRENDAINFISRHGSILRTLNLGGRLNRNRFKNHVSHRADGRDQADALLNIFEKCANIETLNLAGNYLPSQTFEFINFSFFKNLTHLDLSNNRVDEIFFDRFENEKIQSLVSFTCHYIYLTEPTSDNFSRFTANQKLLKFLDVSFERGYIFAKGGSTINLTRFLTQPHATLEVVKLRAVPGAALLIPLDEKIWPSLKELSRQEIR